MLFEWKKETYPKRYAKLFGIPLYEWEYDHETYTYTRKILYGLIKTKKVNYILESRSEKVFKFLNIPIFKTLDDGEKKFYYLFNSLKFKSTDLKILLKKEHPEWFNKGYDSIFTVVCNSGEAYLFFKHGFLPFLKKKNLKNPLVVCTKKYHVDIIKSLFPNLPVNLVKYSNRILKNPFKIDDIIFYSIFPIQHFECFEKKAVTKKDEHYFSAVLKTMNIDFNEIVNIEPEFNDDIKNEVLKKAQNLGLNLNNFIFLSPESQSCINDNNFWLDVIKHYKNLGYDIFINLLSNELNLSEVEYKTCFLTFPEALILAKISKKIIGLRSGFLEYLSQSGVDMDVIYNDFKKRNCLKEADCDYVKRCFTFDKIPYLKSKVREYKMSEYLKTEGG